MRISGLSDVHKMGPHEYSLLAALPGVDPDTLRIAIHGLDRVLLKAQVVATPHVHASVPEDQPFEGATVLEIFSSNPGPRPLDRDESVMADADAMFRALQWAVTLANTPEAERNDLRTLIMAEYRPEQPVAARLGQLMLGIRPGSTAVAGEELATFGESLEFNVITPSRLLYST